MTDDELLATIDRHFAVGSSGLTADQFAEHRQRGECWVCQAHKQLARMRADNSYSVKLTDGSDNAPCS